MADRKHTPDVLAELLSAELPTTASLPAPVHAAPPQAAPVQPSQAWEVEIVTFQEHHGWRPRFVNGREVKDWLSGFLAHDYVNLRGAEGWELTGSTGRDRFYGAADGLQLYFKRRK